MPVDDLTTARRLLAHLLSCLSCPQPDPVRDRTHPRVVLEAEIDAAVG